MRSFLEEVAPYTKGPLLDYALSVYIIECSIISTTPATFSSFLLIKSSLLLELF